MDCSVHRRKSYVQDVFLNECLHLTNKLFHRLSVSLVDFTKSQEKNAVYYAWSLLYVKKQHTTSE
jgi:hypothetical protein